MFLRILMVPPSKRTCYTVLQLYMLIIAQFMSMAPALHFWVSWGIATTTRSPRTIGCSQQVGLLVPDCTPGFSNLWLSHVVTSLGVCSKPHQVPLTCQKPMVKTCGGLNIKWQMVIIFHIPNRSRECSTNQGKPGPVQVSWAPGTSQAQGCCNVSLIAQWFF